MKTLPLQIGQEHVYRIDYAICRFMKSGRAWKTNQNQMGTLVSMKPILEKGLPPQLQIHVRFPGKDKMYQKSDEFREDEFIDVDVYIDLAEFAKNYQRKGYVLPPL